MSPRILRTIIIGLTVLLVVTNAATAGMEWQLIDPGVPLGGVATHLVRMDALGTTYLRIEDQFMVPQFWRLEGNTWTRIVEETYPEAFFEANLAYDPVRNVIVRFGGADKNLVIRDETWEFDGTTWTRRTDVGAPPGRIRAVMAYDTDREVMVLFGGYDNDDRVRNDTWEYDGVSWQERTFSTNPPARYDATMSYDESRRRMVLAFGRSSTIPAMNDTWEYNGNKWSRPSLQNPPIARTRAASAYDPIRGAVYAFGGELSAQTIRWNGSSWDVVGTPLHPDGRYGPNMVFDGSRGTIVLYGGNDSGAEDFGDSWDWDGSTWTQFASPQHEASRRSSSAAFDAFNGRGLIFGGTRCCEGLLSNRTAEWGGESWSEIPTTASPGYLSTPAMDGSPSDDLVLFGGYDAALGREVDRTWRFDVMLDEWVELFPPLAPAARASGDLVFSPSHGGFVLFGGKPYGGSGWLDDTWTYEDGIWQEILSPVRPPGRIDTALSADSVRGNVVLYGGRLGNGLSDTWILTGTTWMQSEAFGPGIRMSHQMYFDSERGLTVLATGAGSLDDTERTWEFDGVSWSSVTTRYSPDMRRFGSTMFWDAVREVGVLSGGRPWGLWASYSDTWAYGRDDDGDLRVGGYDNCPQISNAGQVDSDLDARGDACDCAPSDPGSWNPPVAVETLAASGATTTTLSWPDQGAEVGPGVMYDVVTGGLLDLRDTGSFASATCLASHLGTPSASDSRTPNSAEGFYYVVRSRSACGFGTFGRTELDASTLCP